MATRQYVGARYVPKFYEGSSGTDWTANTQYEPLTIVTRNGNSYTSKKYVPASVGAPEDNASYWASTGIYNAQVETIREELEDLRTDTETSLETLDAKYADITRSAYPGFVMIGDSYGHGGGSGWIDRLRGKLNIADENFFNSAVGGASILTTKDINYLGLLNGLIATMTTEQCAKIGAVIICGGANDDSANQQQLGTDASNLIVRAKEAFPNAIVYLGFISGRIANNFAAAYAPQVIPAYKSAQNFVRGRYLNGVEYALHDRSLILEDDVHPGSTGYQALANAIYAALNGQYDYTFNQYGVAITAATGFTLQGTASCSTDICNGVANFRFSEFLRVTCEATTFNYGNILHVADTNQRTVLGTATSYQQFNRTKGTIVVSVLNGSTRVDVVCAIWLDDQGGIYIRNVDEVNRNLSILEISMGYYQFSCPSIGC